MKHSSRAAMTAGFLALTLFGVSRAALADIAFYNDAGGSNAYSGMHTGGEFKVVTFSPDVANLAAQGANVRTHANLNGTNGGPASLFQTFCMERKENLLFDGVAGSTYDYAINDRAIAGGEAAGFDLLDFKTAYLFDQFWKGTLSSYNYLTEGADDDDNTVYNQTRGESATSLQLAIWSIEGELFSAGLQAEFAADAQANAWVSEATLAGWTNIGDVRVLNVYALGSDHSIKDNYRQDVLVEISQVPLPPAALLGFGLMSALGAVDFVRRRRRTLA